MWKLRDLTHRYFFIFLQNYVKSNFPTYFRPAMDHDRRISVSEPTTSVVEIPEDVLSNSIESGKP